MRLNAYRIGILGGTFDPPHLGHLAIAKRAKSQLRLNRILFIPAFVPPHKKKGSRAKPSERLRMVKLAIRGKSAFKVSPIEIKRRGVSYTVDTLKQVRKQYPKAELFLIIGSDNLSEFRIWKSHKEIVRLATVVVYPRRRKIRPRLSGLPRSRILFLKGPLMRVSSSDIRSLLYQGRAIRHLVPAHVGRYIRSRSLYQAKQL